MGFKIEKLYEMLPLDKNCIKTICSTLDAEDSLENICDAICDADVLDLHGYLDAYPDVKSANMNPLKHYLQYGYNEGRKISAITDTKERLIKSCRILRNTLVFEQGHVIPCCAVNNFQSPVLSKLDSKLNFSIDEISRQRKRAEFAINCNDHSSPCTDCAFVELMPAKQPSYFCERLILGSCTHCNFRCIYCRNCNTGLCDVPATTEMYPIVRKLLDNRLLSPKATVSIAGGEPFLMPDFDATIDLLLGHGDHKIDVNSNLSVWSDAATNAMSQGKMTVRCSIDAGTKDTFKLIKGKDMFDRVIKHIKKCVELNPNSIIVKYICLPENCNDNDLRGLLSLLATGINRLWIDFNFWTIPTEEIIEFAGRLKAEASLLGINVTMGYDAATNYPSDINLVDRVESVYFKYISKPDAPIAAIKESISDITLQKPAGNVESIKYSEDKGLSIEGWMWSEELGSPKSIRIVANNRLIFAGKPNIIRMDIGNGARAGFKFVCESPEQSRIIFQHRDTINIYVAFTYGGWIQLPITLSAFNK